MNKEILERKIKELTVQLKEMIGNEPEYREIWDERVELILKLNDLKNYE